MTARLINCYKDRRLVDGHGGNRMRDKVIYISGPYRAPTERELVLNIREAERAATEVWMMGGISLTPHLNSAHLGGIIEDEEWSIGYLYCLI